MTSMLDLLSRPGRQRSVLERTAHRPWPPPARPWLIAQTWEDLLFAHWPVETGAVQRLLPEGLSVDEYDGSAWLGITPFQISGLRLRGTWPLPGASRFPELNVRSYVTAEDKPGIWFFSLDTSSRPAVEAARCLFRLPYYQARLSLKRARDRIECDNTRRDDDRTRLFSASYAPYAPTGAAFEPEHGSLEHFLTERYCLYAADAQGLHRAEIHHPPWRIRLAKATISLNTMPPDGLELRAAEPLCHIAEPQDVVIWPLEEVTRQ
jgi:uncharacterized protein YqjF (DUF2071 family)